MQEVNESLLASRKTQMLLSNIKPRGKRSVQAGRFLCVERGNGGSVTAEEIYESMDECMNAHKGKNIRIIIPAVRAHAAEIGRMVDKTEDDILRFYFEMKHLGNH